MEFDWIIVKSCANFYFFKKDLKLNHIDSRIIGPFLFVDTA